MKERKERDPQINRIIEMCKENFDFHLSAIIYKKYIWKGLRSPSYTVFMLPLPI